jgi:hypothetical protein
MKCPNTKGNEEYCDDMSCQTCCPHDEFDHYMCLDCGYEKDPGEDIDAAMDRLEDR